MPGQERHLDITRAGTPLQRRFKRGLRVAASGRDRGDRSSDDSTAPLVVGSRSLLVHALDHEAFVVVVATAGRPRTQG